MGKRLNIIQANLVGQKSYGKERVWIKQTVLFGPDAKYECVECEKPMVPILGNGGVRPHFRHLGICESPTTNKKKNGNKDAGEKTQEHLDAEECLKKSVGKTFWLPSIRYGRRHRRASYRQNKKTEIYEPKRRKFEYELKIKQVDQGDNLGGVKMEKSGKIVDAVIVLETKTDKPLIVELFSTNAKTSDWIEQIKEDGISAIEINISREAWKKTINRIGYEPDLDEYILRTASRKWLWNKQVPPQFREEYKQNPDGGVDCPYKSRW